MGAATSTLGYGFDLCVLLHSDTARRAVQMVGFHQAILFFDLGHILRSAHQDIVGGTLVLLERAIHQHLLAGKR